MSLFKLHDTHGLPLSIQLDLCREKGIEPDLLGFMADARKAGWSYEKVKAVFRDAFFLDDIDLLMKDLCYEAATNRAWAGGLGGP